MCDDLNHMQFVKVGPGRSVWMDPCRLNEPPKPKAPAIHIFGGTFSNGRSRFTRYDGAQDVGDPGVIVDLKTPDVKKWCETHGHPWGKDAAGNEGPATTGHRPTYQRMLDDCGLVEYDHASSRRESPMAELQKKYPGLTADAADVAVDGPEEPDFGSFEVVKPGG